MHRTFGILGWVSVFVAMFGGTSSLGSDQVVRADARRALAAPYRVDDPDVAAFRLSFDLLLTNRSDKDIDLPTSDLGNSEATRLTVLGVQSKQPGGAWTYLSQSSWYDTGGIRYLPCRPLPPGETRQIGNAVSGLLVLRNQLAKLGGEPTVRLNLLLFCRQPDGRVSTTSATTEAFGLRLPAEH